MYSLRCMHGKRLETKDTVTSFQALSKVVSKNIPSRIKHSFSALFLKEYNLTLEFYIMKVQGLFLYIRNILFLFFFISVPRKRVSSVF